jgi:hypothetical protein
MQTLLLTLLLAAQTMTFPPPAFSPPPGWAKAPAASLRPPEYAAWSDPSGIIELTIQSTPLNLQQLHAAALSSARADKGNSNILDAAVHTCNGKQDGRLFGFQHTDSNGTTERVGVFVVSKGVQYAALYASAKKELPDERVMASLLSLCAP